MYVAKMICAGGWGGGSCNIPTREESLGGRGRITRREERRDLSVANIICCSMYCLVDL